MKISKKVAPVSHTMRWELLARIYTEISRSIKTSKSPWLIHYHRISVQTKIATKRAKLPHVPGEPVTAEHKNASDWFLRLIPPSELVHALPIVISSRNEHFFVQQGQNQRQLQFLKGDVRLPLSVHNPLAAELVAADIEDILEDARV